MKYFMAKNYLAIPDSTAPSESAFTVAKLINNISKKRCTNPCMHASRLTTSKVNYPQRRLDYCSLHSLFNVITAFVLRKTLYTLTAVKVINKRNRGTSNLTALTAIYIHVHRGNPGCVYEYVSLPHA